MLTFDMSTEITFKFVKFNKKKLFVLNLKKKNIEIEFTIVI